MGIAAVLLLISALVLKELSRAYLLAQPVAWTRALSIAVVALLPIVGIVIAARFIEELRLAFGIA